MSVALDASLPVICPSIVPRARHQRAPQAKKSICSWLMSYRAELVSQRSYDPVACVSQFCHRGPAITWIWFVPNSTHVEPETLTKCYQAERGRSPEKAVEIFWVSLIQEWHISWDQLGQVGLCELPGEHFDKTLDHPTCLATLACAILLCYHFPGNTEKMPVPWRLGFPAIYTMRLINLFLQIGNTASHILLEQHRTDFSDRVSPITVRKHVCKYTYRPIYSIGFLHAKRRIATCLKTAF